MEHNNGQKNGLKALHTRGCPIDGEPDIKDEGQDTIQDNGYVEQENKQQTKQNYLLPTPSDTILWTPTHSGFTVMAVNTVML